MAGTKIKIVIKAVSASELFRAYLDQRRIRFAQGEAIIRVSPKSEDYVLTWFIRDAPGTKYAIEVAEPESAKMNHKATLDASGKDAGIYWFKI